ncbi:orexin receptor type 2-like [Onthophagus taurus]|uniref:orexin receptor type 2-like n=1 Tax=Onthophagus taurus TaxID=166361 RepID=UPI000C200196|nr:orexin receptor type 2-like [Onthophagus taurus]
MDNNSINMSNYNDEEDPWDVFYDKNYTVIGLYIPVFLLALVSNGLVIAVVVKYHYMRNVTNYFLVNLSVADLLVTIVCMPSAAAVAYTKIWYLGNFACVGWSYLQCISVAASVFTITTMALDRYLAITQPFGTSRRFCINHKAALVIITILWMLSMIIFLPTVFVVDVQIFPYPTSNSNNTMTFCGEFNWQIFNNTVGEIYSKKIFGVVCFNVMFAIPGCLIIWAYAMMGKKLCSVRPPSDNNEGSISTQQSVRIMRERKRVALILLLLAFIFAICWLPYNFFNLYNDLFETERVDAKLQQYLLLLGHANSALNPIIYCVMSKNFRKSVRNLLFKSKFNFQSRQTHQLRWYDTSGSSQKLYFPRIYIQHTFVNQHNTLTRVQSSPKTTKTCAV